MKCFYKILFICLLLYNKTLFATDLVTTKCTETPEIYDLENKPQEFNSSNNLRRRAGSANIAKGRLIYIKGKVTDMNCVPIQNAVVFIWHANANGFYQNSKVGSDKDDQNFLGSGKFITNNLGYYNFITVMPGTDQNGAPHVNFLIQHPDFKSLNTEMFFSDYDDNFSDPTLKDFAENSLASLLVAPFTLGKGDIKTYQFNITLGGYNKYTTY